MTARHAYEADILHTFANIGRVHPGISDADFAGEYALQLELEHLKARMSDIIARVNENSGLVKIDVRAWENFCHDELPDNEIWNEKISAAQRNYD